MTIGKLSPELFTWSRWRKAGDILSDKGISCSNGDMILPVNQSQVRKFAIGYCDSENLICRPKLNNKAIMFWDKTHYWFHITNEEFEAIF